MVLSSVLTTRLLGAIETDSLVFLCGAGLSKINAVVSWETGTGTVVEPCLFWGRLAKRKILYGNDGEHPQNQWVVEVSFCNIRRQLVKGPFVHVS